MCTNTKYLDYYVDYDKLKNAGIFNEKPIFKIEVKDKKVLERYLMALKEVYKHINFRTVFLLDENIENKTIIDTINDANDLDYRIVLLKDINIKLLQEINKLNLNYKSQKIINADTIKNDFDFKNIKFKNVKSSLNVEEYLSQKDDIRLIKFLNLFNNLEDARVCYYLNVLNNNDKNKTIKFSSNYCVKSEFFNLIKRDNKIIINYFNNNFKNEVFIFSKGLKDYETLKLNGKIFIKFNFTLRIEKNSSEIFNFISFESEKIEIDKLETLKLIYNNNLKVAKYFNLKIYIKNSEFNDLFNNKLKKLIIEEKLEQNKFKKNFILPNNIIQFFVKTFNLDYKRLTQVSSYFELYKIITNEIFGLSIKNNLIYINPNKKYYDQNFKLIFINESGDYNSLYVDQDSEFKGLEVGEIIYSNLKVVDINLIENNAKLCI